MPSEANGRAVTRAAPPAPEPVYQRATASVSIARLVELRAEAEITSGGLLALGGLVSAILLSTAVIVRAATRGK
jgi:hypothetical protein